MTYLILFFIGCTIIVVVAAALVTMMETDAGHIDRDEDGLEAEYRVESVRGRLE